MFAENPLFTAVLERFTVFYVKTLTSVKMLSFKLQLFFKNAYYSNRMSKEEVLSTMYRLSLNIGDPGDFDIKLWGSMYYLDYYYGLALDGVIPMENFDLAFFSYLDNGTPLDSDLIWRKSMKIA